MQDPAVALLVELVSIDSVNPALVNGGAGETEIAEAVSRHLEASGLRVGSAVIATRWASRGCPLRSIRSSAKAASTDAARRT